MKKNSKTKTRDYPLIEKKKKGKGRKKVQLTQANLPACAEQGLEED
jgi:hypothetical protein